MREDKKLFERLIPYEKAAGIAAIRKYGEMLEEEYREEGIYIRAFVPTDCEGRYSVF